MYIIILCENMNVCNLNNIFFILYQGFGKQSPLFSIFIYGIYKFFSKPQCIYLLRRFAGDLQGAQNSARLVR